MATRNFLFQSFFQAGFECSSHKRRCGLRLDLLSSTKHDQFADLDFERIREFGITTARESARWHLIEKTPGLYEFESLDSILDRADQAGVQILLDLLHFGWPDHVEILSDEFPKEFARFASAVAKHLRSRDQRSWFIAPVNEISFLSWAGGEAACINPYRQDCARKLKHNLVRAAAAASEALLSELPRVRLISPEPVIHIVGRSEIHGHDSEAEAYRTAQFESWDMIAGRLLPELGGRPEYLDILGLNFYPRNEWVHYSETSLDREDPRYRPFREIINEVWRRYERPMFISETGTEDGARAEWFEYVCDEVAAAMQAGAPLHGICLYPILSHAGWEDDRHCHNGLFDYADERGSRNTHWPLAHAIRRQQRRFARSFQTTHEANQFRPHLSVTSAMGVRFSETAASDEPVCPDR